MVTVNIQLFGGRGARGGSGGQGGRRGGGGGGGNPIIGDVYTFGTSPEYSGMQHEVVRRGLDVLGELGEEYAANATLSEAKLRSGVLGCCDRDANVFLSRKYMDLDAANKSYDECVKQGFHPSRGDRSGTEAVIYHEFGHAIVDMTANAMGIRDSMNLATQICNDVRGELKERGVVQMAQKISGYATYSNHEAVAEAFADVKCNGDKANAVSKALVRKLNEYATKAGTKTGYGYQK